VLPDHLFVWLEGARRRVQELLTAELEASPEPAVIRGSHGRMLQLIQPDGSRISDLARLAHITKQGAGQVVDGMEEAGLVDSVSDPVDRRVRLVRRTPLGEQTSARITQALERVESRLRDEVGPRRYDSMRRVLAELAEGQF
jgi:DNA-binding MarR family transcriptional regulator